MTPWTIEDTYVICGAVLFLALLILTCALSALTY